MKPLTNTPIEKYSNIYVKREDMCAVTPAPPFSKIRGLYKHLEKLKADGVEVVGYTETAISMAGWGVAWAAKELGMVAVLFDPQYKKAPELLTHHREMWKMFSPEIRPVPSGMAKVNYYISKKLLQQEYGMKAVMLELGLPFAETIAETAKEWLRTLKEFQPDSTVIAVGSGTICAGILSAWKPGQGKVIGVMCRHGDLIRKRQTIINKAGIIEGGFLGTVIDFDLKDPGWEYMDRSEEECPFPCHPFYDRKAWEWLKGNPQKGKTLFWNIGRESL